MLFNNQHLDRWAFDVELMYLARQLQLPVVEVPVTWSEVEGSKLNVLRDGIRMAIDMAIARTLYVTGVRGPPSPSRPTPPPPLPSSTSSPLPPRTQPEL